MRVYLARFEYKFNIGEYLYKKGYCLNWNPEDRFKDPQYKDFNITILDSIYITNPNYDTAVMLCKEVEDYLHKKFPKNFVLEQYLNVPFGTFNGLSGITEMFILEEGMIEDQLKSFFVKVKDKVQANPKFNVN